MTPLALSQTQLDCVFQIAHPIPRDLRHRYLELVAQALAGREIGDGEVYRAARAAAKIVTWDLDRTTIEPEVDPNSKLITAPTNKGVPIDLAQEERVEEQRQAWPLATGFWPAFSHHHRPPTPFTPLSQGGKHSCARPNMHVFIEVLSRRCYHVQRMAYNWRENAR